MRVVWIGSVMAAVAVVACRLPWCCSDPEDQSCLSHLRQSLRDPTHSLGNWTAANLAASCTGFTSFLDGATCNNGRVYKLSLVGLALTGSISPFLANCTNLQALDLSANALTGPIPPQLSALLNLALLNLSANLLTGAIPPQLSACSYLNVIDLHANALSGPVPRELALLARLSTLDLSRNRLSGPIPPEIVNRTAALPRFNRTSFDGNRDLYGYPLPPLQRRGLSVWAIVAIGLGSGFGSLVLSFAAVCVWLRASRRRMAAEEAKIPHLPHY